MGKALSAAVALASLLGGCVTVVQGDANLSASTKVDANANVQAVANIQTPGVVRAIPSWTPERTPDPAPMSTDPPQGMASQSDDVPQEGAEPVWFLDGAGPTTLRVFATRHMVAPCAIVRDFTTSWEVSLKPDGFFDWKLIANDASFPNDRNPARRFPLVFEAEGWYQVDVKIPPGERFRLVLGGDETEQVAKDATGNQIVIRPR